MPMAEAAKVGDVFVTLTGDKDVIRGEHMKNMKDGVVLANAGHFDVEINRPELEALSVRHFEARHNIEGYELPNGHVINLLAEGRLVNLAAGDGHPAEIMDLPLPFRPWLPNTSSTTQLTGLKPFWKRPIGNFPGNFGSPLRVLSSYSFHQTTPDKSA